MGSKLGKAFRWLGQATVVVFLVVIPLPVGELLRRWKDRRKRAIPAMVQRSAEVTRSETDLRRRAP